MVTATTGPGFEMDSATEEALDFKALPKIELHAHLSGSISRQCLHEVWRQRGETGLEDPLAAMPDGKHDYDLKTFFPLFSRYIYQLVSDVWAVRYTTLAVLRDFAADGVVYLELRTTPRTLRDGADTLSKARYVETVLDAIRSFEAEGHSPLHTRLILSVDRRNSPAEALEVVELCRQFRARGVVGIDLCGDPQRGGVAALSPAFAAARHAVPGLGVTLHFAEAPCSATDAELRLLLSWNPDRIGHVIHVGREIRAAIVARQPAMGIELCLSCNVHANMVEGGFEAHHFGDWHKVPECAVVLCTDDVGVFGSPLSNEYRMVAHHFRLGRADICRLARRAIDVVFGGEEEKERLRSLMWPAPAEEN